MTETKARFISNLKISFISQIIETDIEQPVPRGIFGQSVYEPGLGYITHILDQEVAIWGASLTGDALRVRLLATISVEDARSLREKFAHILTNGLPEGESIPPNPIPRDYNPDHFFKTRIIRHPRLVVGPVELSDLETPYPRGSVGQRPAMMIVSEIAERQFSDSIALSRDGVERFCNQFDRFEEQFPRTRGFGIVRVLEEMYPKLLVRF